MKKNYYCLFLFIFLFQFSMGQTAEERRKIVEYYKTLKSKQVFFDSITFSKNEKELAHQKAKQLGIPTQYIENGKVLGELVRFENGMPRYYTADNVGSAVTIRANRVQPGGAMGLNLAGQDMLIGVWDQNNPRLQHADFDSRLEIFDASITSTSNHATHVTGTLISSGANNAQGRGIAYQANCWANDWASDVGEMQGAAASGLLLSNHSYGLIASQLQVWNFGSYSGAAAAVDNICFNYPKYLPVYAAGNDRSNFSNLNPSKNQNDLLSGNKTSKNPIIVGAVNEVQNYIDNNSVVMSSFSNFGPTDDFRIKPDIVAKGVNVLSTTFNTNTSYGFLSGTSMAAPSVTAGLLLVQQHYGAPFLNAATLKGLAIQTADDAGDIGPDQGYGWGLLNVGKMIEVINGNNVSTKIIEGTVNNNGEYFIDVLPYQNQPIKATLSWTDRAGTIATTGVEDEVTNRLVNDLDLRIFNTTTTHLPWALNKDWNNLVAVKTDNNADNVEQIEVASPSGFYRVRVTHKGSLVGGSQNFSLIITGIDVPGALSVNSFDMDISVWYSNYDKSVNITSQELVSGMKIYDSNGRLIKEAVFNNQTEVKYPLNGLSSGLYFVKVFMSNGTDKVQKIVHAN